jgi:hypothetical protein
MMRLTDKQLDVFKAVCRFWEEHRYAPSLYDLMDMLDMSKTSVRWHTGKLVKMKLLEIDEGIQRSMRPAGMKVLVPQIQEKEE